MATTFEFPCETVTVALTVTNLRRLEGDVHGKLVQRTGHRPTRKTSARCECLLTPGL